MVTTGSLRPIGRHQRTAAGRVMLLLTAGVVFGACLGADDPYVTYVRTSKDFRAVRQDKAWCAAAFPSWTYMPWTHRWSIGYDVASASWARDHGYNGAFVDGVVPGLDDANRAKLGWIDRYDFRFYLDHAAGKRRLHLWDGDAFAAHRDELHGVGLRPVPVDAALRDELQAKIRLNLAAVGSSPRRAAYALDDEISWGHFVHPTMWRITADAEAYPAWLREVYGPAAAPRRTGWMSYEDLRPRLAGWSVRQFDASPLLDQWTFNDSWWNNFVGDLVTYANEVDPRTRAGLSVGRGRTPSAGTTTPRSCARFSSWSRTT